MLRVYVVVMLCNNNSKCKYGDELIDLNNNYIKRKGRLTHKKVIETERRRGEGLGWECFCVIGNLKFKELDRDCLGEKYGEGSVWE